jgi:hypothetical protein
VENAQVILRSGGREVTRCTVRGAWAPGVNFALYAPMDDGRDERYRAGAVRTNEPVQVVVLDNGTEYPILETNALSVAGQPGEILFVNVTAGEDANGNGIPDFWDQVLVDYSGGTLTSIWQVVGSADFDGDGVSNADEYRSGTLAFLNSDYFFAEQLGRMSNGCVRISVLTVPGKVYRVEEAGPGWVQDAWTWAPQPFATTPAGRPDQTAIVGTGHYLDFYVPATNRHSVLRLNVE